jgi:putative transcriptional regulator
MTARAFLVVLSTLALLAGVIPGRPADPAPRIRSLAGELLVASPEMRDPRFARTVIYMISHDASGAQGFVVNRPLGEILLAKLLEQMRMDGSSASGKIRLNGGGPVETLRLFALHTSDYTSTHSTVVKDGVSVTSDPAILLAVAAGKGPRRLRLVLGYAGWAPGQLEFEIQANGWLHSTADKSILFDADIDNKYDRALAKIGISPAMLSSDAGHA